MNDHLHTITIGKSAEPNPSISGTSLISTHILFEMLGHRIGLASTDTETKSPFSKVSSASSVAH